MIDYQKVTYDELYAHVDAIIEEINKSTEFSDKSKAFLAANHLGFFQGVCMARGFNYSINDIKKWLQYCAAF